MLPVRETAVAEALVGHQPRVLEFGGAVRKSSYGHDGHAAAAGHHGLQRPRPLHTAAVFLAVDELIAGHAQFDLVHARAC
jgi:hypothetical protein